MDAIAPSHSADTAIIEDSGNRDQPGCRSGSLVLRRHFEESRPRVVLPAIAEAERLFSGELSRISIADLQVAASAADLEFLRREPDAPAATRVMEW